MVIKKPFSIKKISRYELADALGIGGFGVVYEGHDPYIGRKLAVKVSLLADVAADRNHRESFLRKLFVEAEAAGGLLHPNIVMIYDVGIEEPYYFIAMEYVDGQNLKQFCSPEPELSTADAVDIVIKVCHGLDYAHQRGIVHRDIKSTNIILSTKGEVKVTDFGLAYIAAVKESQTAFAGTPSYMSPEQLRREPPTARSDLFSLGVVLYELLTGEKPFAGASFDEIRHAVLCDPHRAIQRFNADLPPALVTIIDRLLEKNPTLRYQDAMQCAHALEDVFRNKEISLGHEQSEKIQLLKSLVFFADLTEEEVYRVLQIGTWMSFDAGEVIVEQQADDTAFYVIAAGTVAALKGGKALGQMGRGQCFGEISFLLDAERSATVSAVTTCQVLKLNPTKIEILPGETQVKLYRTFAKTLAGRLLLADQRTNP